MFCIVNCQPQNVMPGLEINFNFTHFLSHVDKKFMKIIQRYKLYKKSIQNLPYKLKPIGTGFHFITNYSKLLYNKCWPILYMQTCINIFIYLGFNIAFNTVQVIS